MGKEIINDETETFLIEKFKDLLQDVTADEFQICMSFLGSTKLGTTDAGKTELVHLAVEQAEFNTEDEPLIIEEEHVERYILSATHSLPYFSVSLLCTQQKYQASPAILKYWRIN